MIIYWQVSLHTVNTKKEQQQQHKQEKLPRKRKARR